MKAISLMQPWAWLMTHGIPSVPMKNIENRKWRTYERGLVLVHASLTWDEGNFPFFDGKKKTTTQFHINEIVPFEIRQVMPQFANQYPKGGIVGKFKVEKVVTKLDMVKQPKNIWFFGPYGFFTVDNGPLSFTPLRGQLNFFNVSDEIVRQTGLDPVIHSEKNQPPIHTCHADGCTQEVLPKLLMCANHWRMVPRELQREVLRYYRPGQEKDKQPSPEYLVAARAARLSVKQKEASNQLSFGL